MTEAWQLTDTELLAELRETQRQTNLLFGRTLALIAEIDARDVAGCEGYGTTVELIRDAQNVTRAQARQRLAAAHDVIAACSTSGGAVPPRLAATASALRCGHVNEAQVAVIRDVLAAIPAHAEQHRHSVEQRLADNAGVLDAGQLRLLGKRELAYLDQDGKPPVDDVAPTRSLTMRDLHDGAVRGEFALDPEGAAALRAALSPLAEPRPADDGVRDARTFEQRNADALVELATRALDRGELPTEGGERPHLTVTIDYDALAQQVRQASLDGVGPISPDTARRLACDAGVLPMLLGGKSEPLDVGRKSYGVPMPMRRALVRRDGGCAHPGCAIRPQWCTAHHIVPWLEGGVTALHNLVLLCPQHHRLVHHSKWTIEMVDNYPVFHPPPWLGSRPVRNPLNGRRP
jgi:hypothetical protein